MLCSFPNDVENFCANMPRGQRGSPFLFVVWFALVYCFFPIFSSQGQTDFTIIKIPLNAGAACFLAEYAPKIAILIICKKVRIQLSSSFWVDSAQFRLKTWCFRRSYGPKTFGCNFNSKSYTAGFNFWSSSSTGNEYIFLEKQLPAPVGCRGQFVGDMRPTKRGLNVCIHGAQTLGGRWPYTLVHPRWSSLWIKS